MTERLRKTLRAWLARVPGLDEDERDRLSGEIQVREFRRGTVLVRAGDEVDRCYHVLEGCVRQYSLDEEGRERTADIFTEDQTIVLLDSWVNRKPSEYFLECVENCVLIVGERDQEDRMIRRHPGLPEVIRTFMERGMLRLQAGRASMAALPPEGRYRVLLESRPELLVRVPQYQLASYLGLAPESLSRLKSRLKAKK